MAETAWASRRHSVEYREARARTYEPEALARLVIAARARADISQEELAAHLGLSLGAIADLESGQCSVNDDLRERLARLLRGLETSEAQRAVSRAYAEAAG
jgi:ribosome-binding protein aMBF1 (putative translation factor)